MNRKHFIQSSSSIALGSILFSPFYINKKVSEDLGVQLYTFRKEMISNPIETLKKIQKLGIKKIESATSNKGHYYGLKPKEIRNICNDLGMKLVSGHVLIDDFFSKTIEEAINSGQEYLICSSMPSNGQTLENYKNVAEQFNIAGEKCKNAGIKFGYHNHDYEFESDKGVVLYDVLMDNTQPDLVNMELDLGWVVTAGKNPLNYFNKYKGRFPLWHLKDMDLVKKQSTEFGKGSLDIELMIQNKTLSGVKHIFIEQEEYSSNPFSSMEHNMKFMSKF
jgi:sugar phosphate isomerase/epimerase